MSHVHVYWITLCPCYIKLHRRLPMFLKWSNLFPRVLQIFRFAFRARQIWAAKSDETIVWWWRPLSYYPLAIQQWSIAKPCMFEYTVRPRLSNTTVRPKNPKGPSVLGSINLPIADIQLTQLFDSSFIHSIGSSLRGAKSLLIALFNCPPQRYTANTAAHNHSDSVCRQLV